MRETKQSLADAIFYCSCQQPFNRQQCIQLLNWLKCVDAADGGQLSGPELSILMAFLYAVDPYLLETADDIDGT